MKAKLIRVGVEQQETLFIAKSPDIFGLTVTARSKEEALANTPAAIKEMLDFVGGYWVVTEVGNPEAACVGFAFVAISAESHLIEMLREVRDEGLIYWEPQTERGHATKADMIARLNKLID